MTSLSLHSYLNRKLQELESGCSGDHWIGVQTALKPFRDTRDILRAAGCDVSELEEQMGVVEAAMDKLRLTRDAAVGSFGRKSIYVVTDAAKRGEPESSALQ